jgi:proteasome lid subunit RPN8/RPN11
MECIRLPEEAYLRIVRHAIGAAPMEAVGLVGKAANGRGVMVIELPNLGGPDEFLADPFAQYQAERRLAREGFDVLAIYHSHPGGGTGISETDRNFGKRWNCAHIVVVPDRFPDNPDHLRAWRISDDGVAEISVVREGR